MELNTLLDEVRRLAKRSPTSIALGVGVEKPAYVSAATSSAMKALEEGFASSVALVCSSAGAERVKELVKESAGLEVVESPEPWKLIVELLREGKVGAAIRGSLPSSKVLRSIKEGFSVDRLHRIALLEDYRGRLFFFAPVGVDEGEEVSDKLELVKHAVKLHEILGLEPKIALLSGGRLEDVGRSSRVDQTLCEAALLQQLVKDLGLAKDVMHPGILIEDALAAGATFILAPDGIGGNLVFRTLEFLGGGRGIGALYMDLLPSVFVDVSRAMEDYVDSFALASAVASVVKA